MRQTAAINAFLFFFFWLLVLLAGADKPPPLAFLWLVLVVALCAVVVYWRMPTYINWSLTRQQGRLLRVALEGLLAGLVLAALFAVASPGEPAVTEGPLDRLLWFAVLGMVGTVNALTLYAINAVLTGR